MRSLFVFFMIAVFLFLTTENFFSAIDSTAFVTEQILGRPTDKSMTINIVPKKNLQIYFEYGVTPSVYTGQTDVQTSTPNVPVVITLTNLTPNTRYFYRICYKDPAALQYTMGDERTFITQRAKGSTYRFTIEADSHLYDKKGIPIMMRTTMQNMLNDNPDFLLDLGDTFGDDHTPTTTTQQDMNQLHLNFLPYIGMLCHSTPFLFCLGNHEGESGYYILQTQPNNIGIYGTLARKYYYSNPYADGFYTGNKNVEGFGMGNPENYYAFEWGDALYVVLDAYRGYTANAKPRGWDWTLGNAQYNWFKETLKNSTAKFKFIFAHHILGETRGGVAVAKQFEWGGTETNGSYTFGTNRPGWEAPIHQLMVQNGVNIFFQGHDHLFAQEMLDGIVYQETPMPSDSSYMIGMLANADAYTSNQLNGTGYLRVTVGPDSTKVEYVRSYLPKDTNATHVNGEVAFSYVVAPRTTAVEQENVRPGAVQLEQNFPNPFNPSTDITYRISKAGQVSLKVYDILGNEVATLLNEYKQPGTFTAKFSVQREASGIYYYQLRTETTVITKKAILIK